MYQKERRTFKIEENISLSSKYIVPEALRLYEFPEVVTAVKVALNDSIKESAFQLSHLVT